MTGIEKLKNMSVEEWAEWSELQTLCPSEFGLNDTDNCRTADCKECWRQALESEVTE